MKADDLKTMIGHTITSVQGLTNGSDKVSFIADGGFRFDFYYDGEIEGGYSGKEGSYYLLDYEGEEFYFPKIEVRGNPKLLIGSEISGIYTDFKEYFAVNGRDSVVSKTAYRIETKEDTYVCFRFTGKSHDRFINEIMFRTVGSL